MSHILSLDSSKLSSLCMHLLDVIPHNSQRLHMHCACTLPGDTLETGPFYCILQKFHAWMGAEDSTSLANQWSDQLPGP